MKVFIIFSALFVVALAQYRDVADYAPIPYSFNYVAEGDDGGKSSHEETGDGAGRVQGSYTVNDLEGHTRVVDYVADENGFRANIRTNEPGTANQNPADVVMESTAEGAPASAAPQAPAARRTYTIPTGLGVGAGQPQNGRRFVLVPESDPRARAYYSSA